MLGISWYTRVTGSTSSNFKRFLDYRRFNYDDIATTLREEWSRQKQFHGRITTDEEVASAESAMWGLFEQFRQDKDTYGLIDDRPAFEGRFPFHKTESMYGVGDGKLGLESEIFIHPNMKPHQYGYQVPVSVLIIC